MKKIFYIISCILLICSCNNSNVLEDADFGTGKFREPFRGIFSSRPAWLESTLDWPLINELRPDTVCLSKRFEIEFNEDAIRSDAIAVINVQTIDNQPLNGVLFYCNGRLFGTDGFIISSSKDKQIIEIKCKVLPEFSDSLFRGYITISGRDIDEVNTIALNSDSQEPIAEWSLQYKLGFSPIWIIWLFFVLLIILIIYLFVKIFVVTIPLFLLTSTATTSLSLGKLFKIRWRTGWSIHVLKYIRSEDEALIYIKEGLKEKIIGGKRALIQPKINGNAKNCDAWKWRGDYNDFKDWTNKDRAGEGYAPLDSNGDPIELHHIGQNPDSPLAELTHKAHHCDGNFKILHTFEESKIDRIFFEQERSQYWQNRYKTL